MKRLNDIFDCQYDIPINDIKINSKEVKDGDLFICIKGVTADRHNFIEEAINNGASSLLVSKGYNYSIPYIKVKDTNLELNKIAKKFYDYNDSIKLIGVTGTDGKTTTATLIKQLLGEDICGLIGTTGVKGKNYIANSKNTTPEGIYIYKHLKEFEKEELKYCVIETSSEAFLRNRLDTFIFDIGIHTNITKDHLNYHKTMENYIKCKSKLFKKLNKEGYAILNIDDKHYEDMFKVCTKNILTYGTNKKADLLIKDIKEYENKTEFKIIFNNKEYPIISPLLGKYNVYNLSAAILTLKALNITLEETIKKIKNLTLPKGRLDFIEFNQDYKIILDYAHTPNALDKLLTFLNKIKKNRIITVTGSAGGREKEKRKEMGKIVLEKSNYVIFTMDDPRNENPNKIIDDLISNSTLTNYERIIDRKEAIKKAFVIAKKDDIILIAGKGRDSYMAIGNEYIYYNDYEVIKHYFTKQ